ncbi:LysR family transcriptional regulator [Paenibacillus endoradicis]|uniref:LysR family transcriptional regulator n=1 Tax=Paenibacillus endoradicis TaxID=2972487 RepID=UPI0021595F81|nr:LysR family transcriptional regulator [Paenibacillus endoradicis]MCR8659755.1 LysR family transcriptional regulator [Paenibacillus endoradicis]
MNIEQLTYIVEVANRKSLAEASKTLNISQSALSQAITRLESELNMKIFERTRTGAVTTKEGDKIVEKALHALDAIYQIKEEAYKQNNNKDDLLRITAIPGLTVPLIDTYFSFKNKKTSLNIEVNEKSSTKIIRDIKNDIADIGFIAINKASIDSLSELSFTPIINGELLIFTSKQLEIPGSGNEITADFLKKQTFVLYKDEYVEDFIANFQRKYGPVDIFLKTTNVDIISNAVFEFGAITLGHDISTLFNSEFSRSKMKAYSLDNFYDSSFRFGWVRKNDYKLSSEAKLYIEGINQILIKHSSMV